MIMNSNSVEKKLTKKDLKQVFVRSIAYNSSFNYERQLNWDGHSPLCRYCASYIKMMRNK